MVTYMSYIPSRLVIVVFILRIACHRFLLPSHRRAQTDALAVWLAHSIVWAK